MSEWKSEYEFEYRRGVSRILAAKTVTGTKSSFALRTCTLLFTFDPRR